MARATEVDFYFMKSLEWGISFYEARELIEAKMAELSRDISARPREVAPEPA